MKYAAETGSGALMYIPDCIKMRSGFQKLLRRDTQIHRQHGDRISLLAFFKSKESGLISRVDE
jgi:FPC/CPF motif-containing protein YcgG